MKNLVAVCLSVLLLGSAVFGSRNGSETFALADQVGEPNALSFFVFSTSAGKYILRYDGIGEFSSPAEPRRRAFTVKVGARSRIRSVYYLEHEGDLLLLYEVSDQLGYVLRMEQTKRKLRWSTPFVSTNIEAPVM